MNHYQESYYKTSNYSDYTEREQRYFKLVSEVTNVLSCLNLINKNCNILDYGCAIGHVLKALTLQGYTNCFGIEISDWAIQECKKKGLNVYQPKEFNRIPDVIFALDVLEHMTLPEIEQFFDKYKNCILVIRIPVASVKNGNFHLQVSRNDPTHITCMTKDEWYAKINEKQKRVILNLNLNTIYDSEGVLSALII
jgi:2-polyprenyl-3-methyl-5-hydroxy-6-metoxy-1,4-benzoquinol methylase